MFKAVLNAFYMMAIVSMFLGLGAALDYYLYKMECFVQLDAIAHYMEDTPHLTYDVAGRFTDGHVALTGPRHVFVFVGLAVGFVLSVILMLIAGYKSALAELIDICEEHGAVSNEVNSWFRRKKEEPVTTHYGRRIQKLYHRREQLANCSLPKHIDEAPGWDYELTRVATRVAERAEN